MAHDVDPQDVPLRARAAVLARVDAIESNVPLKRYRKATWIATLPPAEIEEQIQNRRSWKRAIPRIALFMSMPAMVVAIAFAMYSVIIHDQIADQHGRDSPNSSRSQEESIGVLTSPSNDREVIDLIPSNDAPFARGSLFVDQTENAAMLVARKPA